MVARFNLIPELIHDFEVRAQDGGDGCQAPFLEVEGGNCADAAAADDEDILLGAVSHPISIDDIEMWDGRTHAGKVVGCVVVWLRDR
jgi:hypothetical protein